MAVTQAVLDRNYALIEAAAIKGERCPQSKPHGPLDGAAPAALARAGRIRLEVFVHNWRVVTIMEGEHKGKTTAPCPQEGRVPYRIIYKDHIDVRHGIRGQRFVAPVTLPTITFKSLKEGAE